VSLLAGILRISVGLDRNHSGRVARVRCHVKSLEGDGSGDGDGETDPALVVDVLPRGDADVALELYAAGQRKDLLESALGRPIEIVLAERTLTVVPSPAQ
jgi:hypothetical protein